MAEITLIPGTQIIQPGFAAGIEHKAVFRTASQHAFNTLQLRHCAGNCLNLSSPNTCCCGNLPFLQLFAGAYSPVDIADKHSDRRRKRRRCVQQSPSAHRLADDGKPHGAPTKLANAHSIFITKILPTSRLIQWSNIATKIHRTHRGVPTIPSVRPEYRREHVA